MFHPAIGTILVSVVQNSGSHSGEKMCITDVQEVMNCESSILTSFGASCTVPLNSSESPRISDYIPCSCLEVGPSGYKFKVSEMVFISTRNTIICFTKYIKIPVMIYQVKITLKDLFRR